MSRYTVLLVDSEVFSRDLLTNHLRHTGFSVSAASGVPEAEKLIATHKAFPLAILSLAPEEKAAARLTGMLHEAAQETVVLLIAPHAGAAESELLARTGAWDVLIKPFRLEEVKVRLAQAVEVFELRRKLRAALAKLAESEARPRRSRPLEQEVRIPEMSELLVEESSPPEPGAKDSPERPVRDVPGSQVESSYRRQQKKQECETDTFDQLKRLSELFKAGVLSEKEFNEKKKELLGRI
ncbi:SHOCT domain-containing protein [bacterium]|nr:SHOCT domain-containing protein [bacterium]